MVKKKKTKYSKVRYVGRAKPKKISLDNINELKFICIITIPEQENNIIRRLEEFGGRVLMSEIGEGIAKNKSLELLGVQASESVVVLACARSEDADNILVAIDSELNFSIPGRGLGFTIDIEGYMGAKGLFI